MVVVLIDKFCTVPMAYETKILHLEGLFSKNIFEITIRCKLALYIMLIYKSVMCLGKVKLKFLCKFRKIIIQVS